MKCGKCGTPIIPGEEYCRICGTKYAENGSVQPTETVPVEPTAPMDAPVEQVTAQPEILEPVVDIPQPVETVPEVATETISLETPVTENLEVRVEPVETVPEVAAETISLETPAVEPVETVPEVATDTISLETPVTETMVTETINNEIGAPVQEPTETIDTTPQVEPVVETLKEDNKDAEKEIEEIIAKNKKKPNIAFIITLLLLLASIAGNVYLFLNREEDLQTATGEGNANVTLKEIYYDDYTLSIDLEWTYILDDDKLIFSDKTENWGSSLQVISADFSLFVENKDNFNELLKDNALEMTSKTEKTINNKTLYIFGGKYNNYITDIVISDLGDGNVLAAKILYKGEKNDVVLNKVFETMSTAKSFNTSLLNDTNFNFESLTTAVSQNSVAKTEE